MKYLVCSSLVAFLTLYSNVTKADDPVKVAPDHYKILLENDQVRVLEFTDQGGDKIPLHTHPKDYLVYFLAPMNRRFVMQDGKQIDVEAPAGEARWLSPVTHTEENIGTEDAHVLIVEPK
jgi:quercetin dioxygenase-like cupin family protein